MDMVMADVLDLVLVLVSSWFVFYRVLQYAKA